MADLADKLVAAVMAPLSTDRLSRDHQDYRARIDAALVRLENSNG